MFDDNCLQNNFSRSKKKKKERIRKGSVCIIRYTALALAAYYLCFEASIAGGKTPGSAGNQFYMQSDCSKNVNDDLDTSVHRNK
jgi:hypothetical protein